MKRSRLYLSLFLAIAAHLTTGFKTSSNIDEQSKRASNLVNQPVNQLTILSSGKITANTGTNKKLIMTGAPKLATSIYGFYQFQPTVVPVSGRSLHFNIHNKPAWLNFNSSTGLLQGTPLEKDHGVYKNILITASTPTQSVALPAFTITVNPAMDIAHKYGRAKQGTDKDYPFYSAAANVIDNKLDTFNRTRGGANAENWLQVSLPKSSYVYKIIIKANKEFSENLKNADVYLSKKPYLGKLLKRDRVATLKEGVYEQIIELKKGKIASYVIIKGKNDSANTRQLVLAAVEVYGVTPKEPVFEKHNKYYLLDKSASLGTQLTTLTAIDYQDDSVSYSIKEGVPFIVNTNGAIKVSGKLTKRVYHFMVNASDGVYQTSTKITVKTSTRKNLQNAIRTGDHTLVTEDQLYQEIQKSYKKELNQCLPKQESLQKHQAKKSALETCKDNNPSTTIVKTVEHLANNHLNFDYSVSGACTTLLGRVTCHDGLLMNSRGESLGGAFMQGAKQLKKYLSLFDEKGESVFSTSNEDNYLMKLFVLLGDKYRQNIHYPMDKNTTKSSLFYKALFADYAVHYAKANNQYQPDLGDYTSNPSILNAKKGLTKTVVFKPTRYDEWTSSLLYAAPGKPIKIKRIDNTDNNEVWMRVSMLREGSSRVWNPLQYTRPQFIRSHAIKLEPGREYNFSTPYGGPIMIWRKGRQSQAPIKNEPLSIRFKGVVKNPSLRKFDESSITQFIDDLDNSDFDWVNIKTNFVELHMLKSRIKEAFNHAGSFPYNGNASQYLEDLKQYLIINNLNLAGFHGEGLALNNNVKQWCTNNAFDCESKIHSKPRTQHIISDVHAHCGSGCSGNPYDASWAILPTAWGDNHEFGHNLQSNRLKIYGNKSLEVSNNIFPLYSSWKYISDHNIAVHPNTVRPNSSWAFETIYNAYKNNKKKEGANHPLWSETGTYDQIGERLAFYQQLIFVHQSWDIYTKLYLLDRFLTDALKSEESWYLNKQKLGFANYTREEAIALNGNDFMAIALSKMSQQDHQSYFALWGIKITEKAALQIKTNGFSATVPRVFYPVNKNRITAQLPNKRVVFDETEIHTVSLGRLCHSEQGCDETLGAIFTTKKHDKAAVYFVSKYAENIVKDVVQLNGKTYSQLKIKAVNKAGKQVNVIFRVAKSLMKKAKDKTLIESLHAHHVAMDSHEQSNSESVSLLIWQDPSDNKELVKGETYKVIETPILKIMQHSTTIGQIIVSINDFKL